jgi:hypothetical protein
MPQVSVRPKSAPITVQPSAIWKNRKPFQLCMSSLFYSEGRAKFDDVPLNVLPPYGSLRFAFLAGNRAPIRRSFASFRACTDPMQSASAPQPFAPRDKGIARLRLNV